jgi:hypothetical protein
MWSWVGVDLAPCNQFAHAQSPSQAWIYKNVYERLNVLSATSGEEYKRLIKKSTFLNEWKGRKTVL